jgi:hypothetical protein
MSGTEKTPDCKGLLGATIRAKFRPSRALMASVKAKPPAPPPPKRTTAARLARQLALAHWIERAIESGQIACYADVARLLGLSESRITQITALLGLSPALQERVLLAGKGGLGIREALLAAREVDWERQL